MVSFQRQIRTRNSAEEREDVKRILQLNYQLIYRDSGCILLNCFALGPWASGMNVSMSLVDVGILKSMGPGSEETGKPAGTVRRQLSLFHFWLSAVQQIVCRYNDTRSQQIPDGLNRRRRRHV